MSLVIDRNRVVVENDDQSVVCFDDTFVCREVRRALKDISSVSDANEVPEKTDRRPEKADVLSLLHGSAQYGKVSKKGNEKRKTKQEWEWRPRSARRFDQKAIARLVKPTVASTARLQKKHLDMLEDMKKQEVPSAKRYVSPVATRAGQRLYNAALASQKRLDKIREEQEKIKKQNEEKLLFRPQITLLARELGSSGYKPPHERYDSTQKKRLVDLSLREKEKISRITEGCTFHPTVTAASEKMVLMRRINEPFDDIGDRLFYEGGCRLIRQQLRERILEQRAENDVIGAFQITQESAGKLASRLMKWKELSERNREAAQQKYIQSVTQSSLPRAATRSVPELQSDLERQHQKSNRNSNSNQRINTPPSSSSKTINPLREYELSRTRCSNLFYKYTTSQRPECVRLHDIKRQVRDLFPEDFAVVAALAEKFSDYKNISKSEFVDALLQFESLHGPQQWGDPRSGGGGGGRLPLSFSSSLTRTPRGSNAGEKSGLRRSNSAHTTLQKGNELMPTQLSLPCRRSLSATVRGQPSRSVLNGSGSRAMHSRWGVGPLKGPSGANGAQMRKEVAEIPAAAGPCISRGASEEHELPKRLPSLESVELSSLTDDHSSAPNGKRPEEIVAELEALLATPAQSSARALAKQDVGRERFRAGKGVAQGAPTLQKCDVRKIKAPSPNFTAAAGGGGGGGAGTASIFAKRKLLSREVQSMLNLKNFSVDFDWTAD